MSSNKKISFLLLILSLVISCSVPRYHDSARSYNLNDKRERPIMIVCHRGANHLAPENTFASAKKAIEYGAEYVEVDVRMSKDSVFYILHDPWLNRTTNGKGNIKKMYSNQIDSLDAGSWFSKEFANERIPKLKDYFLWIKGKAKVFLDVKHVDMTKLVNLIRETNMQDDVFLGFWNHKDLKNFYSIAPDIKLKMNVSKLKNISEYKTKYGVDIIETCVKKLNNEVVEYCRKYNVQTMVFKRRNSKKWYCQVINSQVNIINLNYPDIFNKMYEEIKRK